LGNWSKRGRNGGEGGFLSGFKNEVVTGKRGTTLVKSGGGGSHVRREAPVLLEKSSAGDWILEGFGGRGRSWSKKNKHRS